MKRLLKHLEDKDRHQSDSQLENPIEIHFDVESQLNSKPKNQVNCDLCGIAIQKKNLATHKKRFHSDKPKFVYHEGVVVDMSRGVYLIREHLKGNGYPIHVIKCLIGPNAPLLFCESKGLFI